MGRFAKAMEARADRQEIEIAKQEAEEQLRQARLQAERELQQLREQQGRAAR